MTLLALVLAILPPGSVEWRQNGSRLGQYEKVNCKGRVRCTQQDLRTVTFDVDAGGLIPIQTCAAGQAVTCDGGACSCAPFVQSGGPCTAAQALSCTAGVCSCVAITGILPYANGGFGTTLSCASNERVTCNGSACSCSAIVEYNRAVGTIATFSTGETNWSRGGFEVAATSSAVSLVCTADTAGATGAEDMELQIRNVTDSTNVCTATMKCNALSATPVKYTCTGTLSTGKIYTFRTGSIPCTTDPIGVQCTLLMSTP